ncbi:Putative teichuronic acid biosynthesis glycosyltransferase TuaG [Poriferisphaera corsica]|uniref:Teichuronic acid biosynthesis glycosyltransferase TuaG n=1 Tax=Poriferisphaera corsica TaxID=2528020 RepID=A0A517YW62_9BACT|nr:glycosyltransferase family 2 protein [Poriferisphaera corsica]QDU34456.1 Putative teichuronic acid biosynthesis glycosyltransferase TuaG [Poriferisphaera corsica]
MSTHSLPRITVITPSFNQAIFLERTIRSVLDQNYPNLQYGIVDGGSTDGSAAIIEKYQDQLDFAIIESDNGQVDAINKGLRRANGDILCYLNSDDTFLPGSLFSIANYFIENSTCNWLIGNCVEIDADDKPLRRLNTTPVNTLAHALIRSQRLEIPQPAIFWRKSLTDQLGLFDESYNFAFDYDLWCRFLAAGQTLHKINVDLATYRLHDQSKTCSLQIGFIENHLRIEKHHAHLLQLKDRVKLSRFLGYRHRQYALLQTTGRPWKHILTHPWWLASQQIWSRLLSPLPQTT